MHFYGVQDQMSRVEDIRLQFARQLYARCLEQYGKSHPESRLVAKYIASLEGQGSPKAGSVRPGTQHYMIGR
jgi:hypothetical protein